MLPNFLIIGAQKAGTTWLHRVLCQHPNIFLPEIKETRFFDIYYDKGLSYYEEFFDPYQNEKKIGEIAPSYLASEKAPKRIKKHLRDIMLICVLRNPLQAAYSKYLHSYRDGGIPADFFQAIEIQPYILDNFLYHKHLTRYLNFFDIERLQFAFFANLKQDKVKFYKSLCNILQVSDQFLPDELYNKYNVRRYPRHPFLSQAKLRGAQFLKTYDLYRTRALLNRLIPDKLWYKTEKPSIINGFEQVKGYLSKYYEEDIAKLSKLLEKDLSYWLDV